METIKERERSPLSRFLPESLPLPSDVEDERTHVGEVVESSTTELIAQARETARRALLWPVYPRGGRNAGSRHCVSTYLRTPSSQTADPRPTARPKRSCA